MTQEQAFEILKSGCNVYLTGPAGSGKTFLLNKYIDYLKKNGKVVGVTASTGIAATHMNGITIHSFSGLGIKDEVYKEDIRKIVKKSYLRKKFEKTGVLIIDEISMLSAKQFDAINLICQAFKKNTLAFGGMQIVCSGDFFQLPPISRGGAESKFVFESEIWGNMNLKICYLNEQHRQQQKDNLFLLLEHIRHNRAEQAKNILLAEDFASRVFDIEPAKLYTHNVDVDYLNSVELKKIKAEERNYLMQFTGNTHITDALKRGCLAPENLSLKVGAKVMFVKNNFEAGYVNGTLGKITGFDAGGMPLVKTINGNFIKADFASWKAEDEDTVVAEISQIPLRLAWAITIHKSQGMNLDSAEIDLSKSFVEGMGYVALSRLKSLSGLKLTGMNEMCFKISKEIFEFDKKLKKESENLMARPAFAKSFGEVKQTEFLNFLPDAGIYKSYNVFRKKVLNGQKQTSNWQKTKLLVDQKFSISTIVKMRGVTEDTILKHLEKISTTDGFDCLEYLKPLPSKFEKIKAVFSKMPDFKLSPVKEILGEDFSFTEIKLARLFLGPIEKE
jgi:ATP-dependent exoDNAse (exonuclease V) alpha subunit